MIHRLNHPAALALAVPLGFDHDLDLTSVVIEVMTITFLWFVTMGQYQEGHGLPDRV
jgi:hypothetical protein